MITSVCVLGGTHHLPMRRWWKEWNERRGGPAPMRNAGYASTMSGISVRAVVAGFALAVAGAFGGRSFGYVRLAFWCGATSVEYKRWRAVRSVGMFGKTETICCALLARICLDENLDVHGFLRGVAR